MLYNATIRVATRYVDPSHLTRGGKTYTRHLLRESYRANGKGLHRTLAKVSHCAAAESAALRLALRHQADRAHLGPLQDSSTLQHGVSFGAVWPVYQGVRGWGIAQALGTTRDGKLVLGHVIARVIAQGARRSAVRLALAQAAGDILGLGPFEEEALDENLAWRAGGQAAVEDRFCAQRTKTTPVSLVVYDVPRSSWEGTHNARAALGYKRDGTKGQRPMGIG